MPGISFLPSAWSPQITARLSTALMMSDRTWLRIELRDDPHRKQAQRAAMTRQDGWFDRAGHVLALSLQRDGAD